MRFTGYEDLTASELADMLSGDAVHPGDVEGAHGVLHLLCQRVAEQEDRIAMLEEFVDRLTRTPGAR